MDIPNRHPSGLDLWGGIECTINRVGNHFSDQLSYTQCYHDNRYIDVFAGLGIKALRFPILWERHQPDQDGMIDWDWAGQQLHKLRQMNIEPVAGLLHHGSGPAYTNLADPLFAEKLASYAGQVARKFPWIKYYTPVNEPLTTARFSGMYGLWYPHKTDTKSFLVMLLNQLKAVSLSMAEIRKVNPSAKLVQTEDLAKIHSTALLAYQRDFENLRRWLSFDLLCGKVTRDHPLWEFITAEGIPESELRFFEDNPCPPDIMGLNYYITSERYLDENTALYPECTHGGNGRHTYADVEAVRVTSLAGIRSLLGEAWQRYQIPVVITEAHLGCTREEQLRWFHEIWDQCADAKKAGINVIAVTAWSLLGAYDWNSLLTRKAMHYEPGVFDNRNGNLRSTALVKLLRAKANGENYDHPVLNEKGWWHQPDRHKYKNRQTVSVIKKSNTPPVLIAGKTGTLGSAFAKICSQRNIPCRILSRKELDILDPASIEKAVNEYKPWAFINATGYVKVDEAEEDIQNCFRVNAEGPRIIAESCKQHSIAFMTFSSDLVFDGSKQGPYVEDDTAGPLNVYGKSKAYAEQLVGGVDPDALIVRTSSFFGPWDQHNFAFHVLNSLRENLPVNAGDMVVSPTYVPDLVNASLDLLIDEEKGIWHLCNDGKISWSDFAIELALRGGYSTTPIRSISSEHMNWKAPRPCFSALKSDRGMKLPALQDAIERYFRECV
jgi:dTDP-4-dehydrorhamnose reductase